MRGLSGLLCAGLLILTAVVVVTQIIAVQRDFPGPGGASVVVHVVAAVVALGAQVLADRRRGLLSALASLVVVIAVAVVLWTQWWGA